MGALRQGVLYDLLGRVRHRDMREATVRQFMRRYQVDTAQAERVARLAQSIHASLNGESRRPHGDAALAASLHEIESRSPTPAITSTRPTSCAGRHARFSQKEQARLSRLVLAHRGKLTKIDDLPEQSDRWALIFALRLAALCSISAGAISRCPFPPARPRKAASS